MALQNHNNIVFLDLELTALPSQLSSKILEVAVLITTSTFEEITRDEWCIRTPRHELVLLSDWHQQHFKSRFKGGNGLFDDVLSPNSLDLATVTHQVLTLLTRYCPRGKCKLAGFSVHCDREILFRHMPAVYHYMSHQILDVSTLLNLTTVWAPADEFDDKPIAARGEVHRAMGDVVHSVAMLKYLTRKFICRSSFSTVVQATVQHPITPSLPLDGNSSRHDKYLDYDDDNGDDGDYDDYDGVGSVVGFNDLFDFDPSSDVEDEVEVPCDLRIVEEPHPSVCALCGMEPPNHHWEGHESEVTAYNCERFGMNEYCFDKYGYAMGLDHWWDDVEESDD